MGMRVKADTFSALGRTAAGQMELPKKLASVAPSRAFEGESLILCLRSRSVRARVVLAWAGGSESNTISSSRYAATTCSKNLVTRRRAAALRHDQPPVNTRWGAKRRESDRALVSGCPMERRHEVKEGKNASFAQRVQDLDPHSGWAHG